MIQRIELPRSTGPPHPCLAGPVPPSERIFLLLEDPSHFARYLSRLPRDSRAGVPHDGRRCPLARFLATLATGDGILPQSLEVGSERVFLLAEDSPAKALPVAPLPYWAQLFVERVDTLGPGADSHHEMPAVGRVREILDEALLIEMLAGHDQDPGDHRSRGLIASAGST